MKPLRLETLDPADDARVSNFENDRGLAFLRFGRERIESRPAFPKAPASYTIPLPAEEVPS